MKKEIYSNISKENYKLIILSAPILALPDLTKEVDPSQIKSEIYPLSRLYPLSRKRPSF